MIKFSAKRIGWKCKLHVTMLTSLASCISPVFAENATDIQRQIEAQRTENEQLKEKIATIEKVLKTDVCSNPEAAKLLESDDGQPATNFPTVK